MHEPRRTFLKKLGIAGSAGLTASLAGCTGNGGNDGNGGGGSVGTATEQRQQVNITLGPEGFAGIVVDYITNKTSILDNLMAEKGYEANVQETFEGSALFASGGSDFANFSTIEAALLGSERDLNLAVCGRVAANWLGMWTRPGSPYDVDGDAMTALNRMAEYNANVGIGTWAGGDIPAYNIIANMADLNFGQDTDDFNIRLADYFALGKLVQQGDLDVASTGPPLGMISQAMNEELVPSFYIPNFLADQEGFTAPDLNNWVVTQEFLENNRGAVEALIQAWHEGSSWLHDDPVGIVTTEENIEKVGAANEAEAEWLAEWALLGEHGLDYPEIYRDNEITDEFIDGDTTFLNNAADAGTIPSNWQDHVEYVKIPQE